MAELPNFSIKAPETQMQDTNSVYDKNGSSFTEIPMPTYSGDLSYVTCEEHCKGAEHQEQHGQLGI